jgi:hypothetical protein
LPYANYQYFDNTGNLYQVTLPSDFANALGQTPASGSEPYLDPTISPRFVSYRSTSPPNQRQAIISTTSLFARPPLYLTVGGVNYTSISFTGESVPAVPFNLIQAVQGPQGAPGPTGATGPAGSIAAIANNELVGNVSGGSAVPIGLTAAQSTSILNQFTNTLQGLVSGSGGGTTNFLRADNTWASPGSGLAAPTLSTLTAMPTSSGQVSIAHGLGRVPYLARLQFVCQTAEHGFAIGDVIEYTPIQYYTGTEWRGTTLNWNATNLKVNWCISASGLETVFDNTGAAVTLTNANWKYQFAYW